MVDAVCRESFKCYKLLQDTFVR